jgi:hypothetical protein
MTVERSFSTLRRLKIWFRSMIIEDRLSALCLINVYHKVDILDQIDHIIDIFANFKSRRLDLCCKNYCFLFVIRFCKILT